MSRYAMKNISSRKTPNFFAVTILVAILTAIVVSPASGVAATVLGTPLHINSIQPKLYKVISGTWGATGAEMSVEKESVKLKFDCADGEIPLTLKMDKRGNFKVEGTYTRRGFGPIRINKPPTAEPVIYEGKVTGRSMKFKITVIATGDLVGEFTLKRGREATIHSCR